MAKALILIVDQSRETRAMYADCFRFHGYDVAEAATAVQGFRLFRQLQPDLIVTELADDPEWTRVIELVRRDRVGRSTAIIACSTSIEPGWPHPPPGVEVDSALAKPISPRELLLEAEHLLGRRFESFSAPASTVAAPV
jgi:CheY-like chemotaxis protein